MNSDLYINYLYSDLKEELLNQNVPHEWSTMIISAMYGYVERIHMMMGWLIEHRDIVYHEMDLVNEILNIKKIFPVKEDDELLRKIRRS